MRRPGWTRCAIAALVALAVASCGGGSNRDGGGGTARVATRTALLPGTGRPQVTIGDKNFTEQFVLGSLYLQALEAQGFSVVLNRNIGPTAVTLQALSTGKLGMYPEYLDTWDTSVAGYQRPFPTARAAYRAGQEYALAHGFKLLHPTPFSDTDAIAVNFNYAVQNGLTTIGNLGKVASEITFGAPPQFQQDPGGLPALESSYGFEPGQFKPLEIGQQYQALDQDQVQAADVNTTDGQLLTGGYTLLRDPRRVFGWGNVVPVASMQVLEREGPAFSATINKVSSLLTLKAMRQLNAAVDIQNQNPATVARQFLIAHGLIPDRPG